MPQDGGASAVTPRTTWAVNGVGELTLDRFASAYRHIIEMLQDLTHRRGERALGSPFGGRWCSRSRDRYPRSPGNGELPQVIAYLRTRVRPGRTVTEGIPGLNTEWAKSQFACDIATPQP